MGVSKQAFTEASRREDLSIESLAPVKELLLKAAREKNPAHLSQVDGVRLASIMSEYLSRKVVRKLLDTGVMRHATSTRLRNVDEELRDCFSPLSQRMLPDRAFRELVADLWKNEAGEPFAYNPQVVKVNSGARADQHGRTFSMFVQDTKAVRRYLRYFNKKSSPFVGIHSMPVFFTKETFLARNMVPTSSTGSRYGSGVSFIREKEKLPEKALDFLASKVFEAFHAQVSNFKNLRVNTYYHQAHTMGLLINNARDLVVNAVIPANINRNRNNNAETTPPAMLQTEFLRLYRNRPVGPIALDPLTSDEGNLITKVINSISLELQKSIEPMFNEIYTEMRATPADMNKVAGFNDLITWGPRSGNKFLIVTFDFTISVNSRDKLGRPVSKLLTSAMGRYSNMTLAAATQELTGADIQSCFRTRPTEIPRGLVQPYEDFRQEFTTVNVGQETTNGRVYSPNLLTNGLVMDDKIIEVAARDTVNAFNAMLRKNIWLSLL